MFIVISKDSPRVVMLNHLTNINTLVIAPSYQEERYKKFLAQGHSIPKVKFLKDFTLPNIVLEIRKVQSSNEIQSITTLSEENMDWVGILHDHFVNQNTKYVSNILFKDKYLMRSLLIDKVAQPYFRLLSNIDEYNIFWLNSNTDKAIIKPRYGSGSEQVIKVNRGENIEAWEENFFSSRYIIEEFVNFENMLSCDGYSVGKDIVRFFSHDYGELLMESLHKTNDNIVRTNNIYYTDIDFLWSVFKECSKILEVFSLEGELTPFHFEWFYDINTKQIYFCEVGKRFGGGSIPFLIEYSFGVDILQEYWLNLTSDVIQKECIKKKEELPIPNVISATYSSYKRNGTIIAIPDLEKFNWTLNTWFFASEGTKTKQSASIVDCLFISEFISKTDEEYYKNLKKIRSLAEEVKYIL